MFCSYNSTSCSWEVPGPSSPCAQLFFTSVYVFFPPSLSFLPSFLLTHKALVVCPPKCFTGMNSFCLPNHLVLLCPFYRWGQKGYSRSQHPLEGRPRKLQVGALTAFSVLIFGTRKAEWDPGVYFTFNSHSPAYIRGQFPMGLSHFSISYKQRHYLPFVLYCFCVLASLGRQIVSPTGTKGRCAYFHWWNIRVHKAVSLSYNTTHCLYRYYLALFMWSYRDWGLGNCWKNANHPATAVAVNNKILCLWFRSLMSSSLHETGRLTCKLDKISAHSHFFTGSRFRT